MQSHMRKHLSMPGLLAKVRKRFSYLKDPLAGKTNYSLVNCLMSALAIFGLKYPSLLKFDQHRNDHKIKHNLNRLYGVDKAPCDTYLRERLDSLNPRRVETSFKCVLSAVQSSHLLKGYRFMDEYYLLSSDGTGVFSSNKVYCPRCCMKRQNGKPSYYHQLLTASLVHPNHKPVFPLACESIAKKDGVKKNDCELNAAKRLITKIRHQHPKLKLILVEDSLYANAPHIQQLRSKGMKHITVVKPTNHEWLFDWVAAASEEKGHLTLEKEGKTHRFEWVEEAELSERGSDVKVNFLEYWETDSVPQKHKKEVYYCKDRLKACA